MADGAAQAPKGRRPTIRDVAALAGVAIKTVSRVMNNDPTVSWALAQRTRAAAESLGYRPDRAASALRRGDHRSGTIGLVLSDVGHRSSAALLRAIEDAARERDALVLVGSHNEDADRERELSQALIDRRVDGLIIVPTTSGQSYLQAERNRGVQMVLVDRDPRPLTADVVVSDDATSAEAAVKKLAQHGHRRIAYLGEPLDGAIARRRFDGYVRGLASLELGINHNLVHHDIASAPAASLALTTLLCHENPPTAVFTAHDSATIGSALALHFLQQHQHVALLGFGESALPGISTIAEDTTTLGRIAVERLFERIDGQSPDGRTDVIPCIFTARGSGEIPAR